MREKEAVLFKMLESKGWYWENGYIYAPYKTIWFCNLSNWLNDIWDFSQRMKDRKEKIIRNKKYHRNLQQHQHCVDDAESLINVIESFIKENQHQNVL